MKNFTARRGLHFYALEFDLMKNLSVLFLVVSSFQIQAKVTAVTKLTTEMQQERSISGVVTNGKGEPLPGVSIVAEGTINGTTTDFDGTFVLKVNNDVKTVVVSFADYETTEITIGDKTEFKIILKDVFESLLEFIVIGYGTQKRADITGAVSSVPKERLENLPVTNILHAIEGTTAGLKITQGSSVPGSSASVQIRGVNSINANSSPLIVLDGIPFFGTTNDISIGDITSIEILKDASAVAIYGTRGSNGVILITSERGNSSYEKPIIKYRGYVGFEEMAYVLKPMGAAAYVQKYADFQKANGLTQTTVLPNASEVANYDTGDRKSVV